MKFVSAILDEVREARQILRDWSTLSPKEQWEFFLKFGDRVSYVIGIRFFSESKTTLRVFLIPFINALYFALAFFTIFVNMRKGNFAEGISCLSISGLYITGLAAAAPNYSKQRYAIIELFNYGGKHIYNSESFSKEESEIRLTRFNKSIRRCKYIILLFVFSFAIGTANPIYIFYRDGIFHTLTGVIFPFVERYSKMELYINVVYQSISVIIAGLGVVSLQIGTTMLTDTYEITVDISISEIRKINMHLRSNDLTKAEIRKRLNVIFQQIRESDSMVIKSGKAFYWYCLLSPFIITYTIGLSIYAQYVLNFASGYGIAVMSYTQMCSVCIIGQIAVDRNDRLCDAVYSELNWYLLPTDCQYDIVRMLMRLQNGAILTIGPFETYSFTAAKVLTQRIHSFLMFLFNIRGR